MFSRTNSVLTISFIAAISSSSGLAAVSAEEAKQLGTTLTPWGAEKAGNKDGSIPAYTGEVIKVPTSYDRKNPGQHPDPFNEKPLFSITAQNYTQYASKLDGSAEMFKRFPGYRMDIYPSHRSWVYPKYVNDNSLKNATSCKAAAGGQRLEGCYGGTPFPIPKTGDEVMWNHLTQFEARSVGGLTGSWVTPSNGVPVRQVLTSISQTFPFYDPARTTPWPSNILFWKMRTADVAPARMAGSGTLILDPLDWTSGGRRAYQYIPGQRRVKLAPDLAYDTPSPYSGGSNTMDDQKGFLGALDRFDFKLIGKKEKYIPYNNFASADVKTCPDEKLMGSKNFANPDCMRWELHRVWQVKATLKPEFRHIYKKREFFWDEDVPGAGVAENYDGSGALYRIVNTLSYPYYEAVDGAGGSASGIVNVDLATGIVGSAKLQGCKGCGETPIADKTEDYYTPEAMAGSGIR